MEEGIVLIADRTHAYLQLLTNCMRKNFSWYNFEYYDNGKDLIRRLNNGLDEVMLAIIDDDLGWGKKGTEIIQEYSSIVKFPFVLFAYDSSYKPKKQLNVGASLYLNKSNSWEEVDRELQKLIRERVVKPQLR